MERTEKYSVRVVPTYQRDKVLFRGRTFTKDGDWYELNEADAAAVISHPHLNVMHAQEESSEEEAAGQLLGDMTRAQLEEFAEMIGAEVPKGPKAAIIEAIEKHQAEQAPRPGQTPEGGPYYGQRVERGEEGERK